MQDVKNFRPFANSTTWAQNKPLIDLQNFWSNPFKVISCVKLSLLPKTFQLPYLLHPRHRNKDVKRAVSYSTGSISRDSVHNFPYLHLSFKVIFSPVSFILSAAVKYRRDFGAGCCLKDWKTCLPLKNDNMK